MILSLISTKGGSGKSTLCSNLFVSFYLKGFRVRGIDSDSQKTFFLWSKLREKEPKSVEVRLESNLHEELKSKKEEIILIDVGARDSKVLRSAILASDLLLIPFVPSASDLWALEDLLQIVEKARGYGFEGSSLIVLNACIRSKILEEVEEPLKEIEKDYSTKVLETKIYSRIVYRRALSEGLSVLEMRDKKAKEEIENLTKEILNYEKKERA